MPEAHGITPLKILQRIGSGLEDIGIGLVDGVEPGVLRQPQEDLLHEILRFGRIAQALAEETQQRRIIALRDLVERMLAGRTGFVGMCCASHRCLRRGLISRSEEHTSELQSLMRNSYAVFCLNKKNQTKQ